MLVVIIKYEAGNVRSVVNALSRLGAEVCVSDDEQVIRQASHVILPGVGHALRAMADLERRGLTDVIRSLNQPMLGICIGMQLMCRQSQEGPTTGLGIFDCAVSKMEGSTQGLKIPHVGWNTIYNTQSELFKGFASPEYVYYVHSYAAGLCAHTIATTAHGAEFSGALRNGNFFGTQFHPEKSGDVGERILKNFLELT
ncbi:MAG: imidazole glycerol phosphate synthase subunit HisH [Mucinivorans sp.]